MLRESSSKIAMIFCCEESSATVIAGRHSNISNIAISKDCSNQITLARQLLNFGAAAANRIRIRNAKAVIEITISKTRSHPGHELSSTNRPLRNTELGYLKKN